MKTTTLDSAVNMPSPDFTSIMTELNATVAKIAGEKPKQTDIRASLMDDGSAIVVVGLAFPSGGVYKGLGSGRGYDAALRLACEDIKTQIQKSPMANYNDPTVQTRYATATEVLEETGYGHGV
ncbi:hypothetical protein HY637_01680 [Candidatus Woesearchaeota archaeon]|nr:hypothetical protein [Candidatus Woesearchaeota archaeon]